MQQSTGTKTKYIDYLTEDEVLPGQQWVCVSFLSPEGIKNCSVRGLKVRGVYPTQELANKRADELHNIDPDFHVFVGEVGKWLAWDPDPNDVKDQVYQEKELNDIMKGYKDNLEKSKKMQHNRKEDMLKQAAKEEQSRNNNDNHNADNQRSRLQKKLEAKKQQKKIDDIATKNVTSSRDQELKQLETELTNEDNLLKNEKKKIDENAKQIDEKTQSVMTIEEQLAKIQKLYEKSNKKN